MDNFKLHETFMSYHPLKTLSTSFRTKHETFEIGKKSTQLHPDWIEVHNYLFSAYHIPHYQFGNQSSTLRFLPGEAI